MKYFLSCDWGTSSFRLRLVTVKDQQVIDRQYSDQGIASTFAAWKTTGSQLPQARFSFYLQVVQDHIEQMERRLPTSLKEVPLVISGMASASIGMQELPYAPLPFATHGGDTQVAHFQEDNRSVLLVSGVRSETDVMRGEETQLIGLLAAQPAEDTGSDQVYIFPGTHSKHMVVAAGQLQSFATYMTGEFFELLTQKSILQVSVAQGPLLATPAQAQSFRLGVRQGIDANLLHTAFMVRTHHLFQKRSKEENYSFLSGVLMGTELKALVQRQRARLFLCSSEPLRTAYQQALDIAGLSDCVHVFSDNQLEIAVVSGQFAILQHHLLIS